MYNIYVLPSEVYGGPCSDKLDITISNVMMDSNSNVIVGNNSVTIIGDVLLTKSM